MIKFDETSNKDSQCTRILNYLKDGNKITSLEALNLFGCMRLSARIYDLRARGYTIHSEKIRNNINGKRYSQYSMKKEK